MSVHTVQCEHWPPDVRSDYGQWLDSFAWDTFMTLTFGTPHTCETAVRKYMSLVRRLERAAQNGVSWFMVVEHAHSPSLHLHALLNGCGELPPAVVLRKWPFGRASVERFEEGAGAPFYIVKELIQGDLEYFVSVHPWTPRSPLTLA